MERIRKILVIDDEPDVVSYLSAFLEDEGFQVLAASNGPDGLTMAREEAPDLITLDITMPGMSGIEVLTTLRRDERLNGLPVVIITGVTSFDKLTDYRDVRAPEGFMQKPIDLVRLLSMIKGILDSPA
jgi:twitching motility two-component system response regulator PilH